VFAVYHVGDSEKIVGSDASTCCSLMNTQDAKSPVTSPRKSGIRAALEYTGIPPSWLDKRPRLPSRNWLIFLSVTSSITGLYIYDRRQCRRIKQEYIEKVKYLSEQTADHLSWPRKVTVYGAKWPGDEDYDQAIKYFRKYVKVVFAYFHPNFTLTRLL